MTVRSALRAAAVDTYQFSWRLFVLNTALSAGIVLIVVFVSAFPLVLFVAPLVTGPLAAGLVYSVVTLIREQELRLSRDLLRERLGKAASPVSCCCSGRSP